MPKPSSSPLPRICLGLAVVALSLWLGSGVYTSGQVYNSLKVWPELNQWIDTNHYISRGGIYPFLHSITGADPYAEYHALLSESYHGHLLPNVFAGGTIDTERSVLTGFSRLENFRRPSWSYARYFAEQGYTVQGAHAGYETFYNYYATDYLIWANDAAKELLGNAFTGTGPDISPCFLMNELFRQCGWEGSGYTNLTDKVLDAVPMLHASGRYLVNGAPADSLPADFQELVKQMEHAQYYLTRDAKGVHP